MEQIIPIQHLYLEVTMKTRHFLNSYTPTPTSMEMSHLPSSTLPLLLSNPDSPDTETDPYDDLYVSVNGDVPISQPHHRNRTITTGIF